MRRSFSAAIIFFLVAGFASAQDLSSTIGKVGSKYAQAYVTPAANAFGVDLNSGLFHTAKVGGMLPFGLNLYVGVQVGAALITSPDQSFNLSYQDTMYFSQKIGSQIYRIGVPATFNTTNAPTIFGSTQKGMAIGTASKDTIIAGQPFHFSRTDTINTIGGLLNTSIAPIPIPQVGVGSLFGTDIFVRYLPKIKLSSYGSVSLFGYGIRHSISQYIPLIPIDIAVQLGWQNFSLEDSTGSKVLNASTFAANLEVSKTFAIITLYGGLQTESSTVDVNYSYTPPVTQFNPNPQAIPISFSVKGKNTFRALVGFNLGLGPLVINADYSIGAINAVTAGIGISI
ncbi:MAG: hypothetical protein M1470_00255 [Bacteroidetes bacterium]|nr:hypothetical protein [Bacteroidota bacterium]